MYSAVIVGSLFTFSLVDLNHVSPEMPVYLLQGDETSDEEMIPCKREMANKDIPSNSQHISSSLPFTPRLSKSLTHNNSDNTRVEDTSSVQYNKYCSCVGEGKTDVQSANHLCGQVPPNGECTVLKQAISVTSVDSSLPLPQVPPSFLSPDFAARLRGFDINPGSSASVSSLLELVLVSSAQTVSTPVLPLVPRRQGSVGTPSSSSSITPNAVGVCSLTQTSGIDCSRDTNSTMALTSGDHRSATGSVSPLQCSTDSTQPPPGLGCSSSSLCKEEEHVKDMLRVRFMSGDTGSGGGGGSTDCVQQQRVRADGSLCVCVCLIGLLLSIGNRDGAISPAKLH